MKVEERKYITMSMRELRKAVLAACGLPLDLTINHFTVEEISNGLDGVAISMSVTVGTDTEELFPNG